MQLKGVVALVTGGASGLGAATVRKFVQYDGRVIICDLAEEAGARLAAELGREAVYVRADVTDEVSTRAAVHQAGEHWGGLQVVVNCAGIAPAQKVLGKNGLMPLEDFKRAIAINLIGTFNVIRLAVELMSHQEPNEDGERGVIINTASVAAFEGQIGQAAYSASKAGIVGLTLPLAREFAQLGIRVMTIAPGLFETPMFDGLPANARDALGKMTPFPSRLGKPEEYAQLVTAIVENSMLNGTIIRLDGAVRMPSK